MTRLKQITVEILRRLLPDPLKRSLFHLSFNLAREEFGTFAYEYASAPNMDLGLAAVARRGFSPKTIIDVGAFEGQWSKAARRIWPHARLYMIEPLTANRPLLLKIGQELDATVFFELLGADNGKAVEFNVMGTGSSVMSEHSPVPRTIETRTLRTLDSLPLKFERPALLKIDAQGYEIEILKGSLSHLVNVDAVLLEIAIIEINKGTPLLHDVVAFMRLHGFVSYDILEIHRRPLDSALNQVDIIFVRVESRLIEDKRHFA